MPPQKRDLHTQVPRSVREAFGIVAITREVHPAGSDAQLWYATTSGGQKVVLRYELWWPRPLEVLCVGTARLGIHNAAHVAAPILNKGGVYVHADGWTLWQRVTGEPPTPERTAASVGTLVANLHRSAHKVGPMTDMKVEPALVRWGRQRGLLHAHAAAPGHWFVHGDLHAHNIIVSADTPVAIDWVDAGVGTFEFDLALTAVYAVEVDVWRAGDLLNEVLVAYAMAHGPGCVSTVRQLVGPVASIASDRHRYYGGVNPAFDAAREAAGERF